MILELFRSNQRKMKRLFLVFSLCIVFASCQQDDDTNSPGNSVTSVNSFLNLAGGFRINFIIEEGVNKTNEFSPYLFVFGPNGSVAATNASESVNGTYLVFSDDNRTELRMNFPNTGILFELTDDWYLISKTDDVIRFEDSGDVVQFQRQN